MVYFSIQNDERITKFISIIKMNIKIQSKNNEELLNKLVFLYKSKILLIHSVNFFLKTNAFHVQRQEEQELREVSKLLQMLTLLQ